jgi:hypothetical protein
MRRVSAGSIGAIVLGVSGAAGGAGLEPHRAAYSLSLGHAHQASALTEVRGGLVMEWRRECDGWLSQQRLGFVASGSALEEFGEERAPPGNGFVSSHDVRFSSWEALDGSRMRYAVRSYDGSLVSEEYRGEAWVKSEDGGSASFTVPRIREIRLPGETVFPTDHLERVLASAAAGERLVSHTVFDGWGFDALTQITTVIGSPVEIEVSTEGVSATMPAWPMSMAYYNIERGEEEPSFEATFKMTADGVLHELQLDYGDFRLDGTLEVLERFQLPDC